ncbi:MAG TPA: hemolysin family protein [Candidatus Saccharimonadales bacterium]|nr:hemolysin family protein [Candidatus Saccharimonadales bacterium]
MNVEFALFSAVILLLGNAFFVGAEFGLVSVRRSAMELRARSGSRAAKTTLQAMEQLSIMLAAAQLGITLCSLGLGAVGEPVIAHLLETPLHAAGVADYLLHPISFAIALAIMVYLHVVIGEMVPKNLALADPDKAALVLTPPLVFIVRVLRPAVHGLNYIANACIRLLGIEPKGEVASTFTSDEVAGFVEESQREGLISEDEGQLLTGALRFDERNVKKVLLPLHDIVTVTTKATPADIEALVTRTGFSRFPVKTSRGKLAGYIHMKDLLAKDDSELHQPIPVKEFRPLTAVKASHTLRDALTLMQRSGAHLAQVTNNRGKLLGVITLEDVLEELVGEIRDDSQKAHKLLADA